MARKFFKPEQIINKLREAEVLISQGAAVGEASRKIGVAEQTYYRWRRGYRGVQMARKSFKPEQIINSFVRRRS